MTDSPEAPESLNNLQGQLLKTIEPREIFNSGEYFYFSVDHKGLFSKPSGDYIVAPNFCWFSYRLQILATCFFFFLLNCVKFDQDWILILHNLHSLAISKNKQVAKIWSL